MNNMRAPSLIITAMLGLIVNVSAAHASSVTFVTPSGSTVGGNPVNASAMFTTGPNTLSISLTDLLANPTDVGQLLSDLFFTTSTGATSGTLGTNGGQEVTVFSDGTSTLGSTVPTGWVLQTAGAGLELNVLGAGGAGPTHLIIGPSAAGGNYTNANGSIAGNRPHNPFLNQMATFAITIPGLLATDTVTSATFSFGTTSGENVAGVPSAVPLPAALPLFATGLGGLGLLGWRRKRKAQGIAA
jgi:hypothetical protein